MPEKEAKTPVQEKAPAKKEEKVEAKPAKAEPKKEEKPAAKAEQKKEDPAGKTVVHPKWLEHLGKMLKLSSAQKAEIHEKVLSLKEDKADKESLTEMKVQATLDEEKQKVLALAEVSLWIDTYDDIFSDFDPRPYSQRSLSDDFLLEAKKVTKENAAGSFEFKFLVPANARDSGKEAVIRKRLREHFKRHHTLLRREAEDIKRKAVLPILGGMALMFGASVVASMQPQTFVSHLLFVLLEPSGWFLVWYGFDQIFYAANQKSADLEFYEKMAKVDVGFLSY